MDGTWNRKQQKVKTMNIKANSEKGKTLVRGRSCVQSTPAAPPKAHKSRAFEASSVSPKRNSLPNDARTPHVDSWKIRGVCSPDVHEWTPEVEALFAAIRKQLRLKPRVRVPYVRGRVWGAALIPCAHGLTMGQHCPACTRNYGAGVRHIEALAFRVN